jgi:hypothetical protein
MAWKSPDHMRAGLKAAAVSPKTPKHLVPHLEARMNFGRSGVHPVVSGKLKTRVAPKAAPAKAKISMGMSAANMDNDGDEMMPMKAMKSKMKKGKSGAKKFDPMYGC